MASEMTRVRCPDCRRVVAGRVPKGGDGSAWYPHRHNTTGGLPCNGHTAVVTETGMATDPDQPTAPPLNRAARRSSAK